MSLLYPVIGATVLTLVIVTHLRRDGPVLAMITSLAFTVLLLLFVLPEVGQIVRLLEELSSRAGVRSGYLAVLWKAIGISYLTAFAAELSRDAGEKTIASGVELAGKVMVLITALPVVVAILDQLVEFLP